MRHYFVITFMADTPCHQATINRALIHERVKVDVQHDTIDVSLSGKVIVRLHVEEGATDSAIIIEQFGIGMIDGQSSLMLMESNKTIDKSNLFGGQYGIGLKQLFAVLAHLEKDNWRFSMFGTVFHDRTQQRGWSRLWSSDVDSQLNVHGEMCFGRLGNKVSIKSMNN